MQKHQVTKLTHPKKTNTKAGTKDYFFIFFIFCITMLYTNKITPHPKQQNNGGIAHSILRVYVGWVSFVT
jgi:hypothetical protein